MFVINIYKMTLTIILLIVITIVFVELINYAEKLKILKQKKHTHTKKFY
jgi:hypothetical protein